METNPSVLKYRLTKLKFIQSVVSFKIIYRCCLVRFHAFRALKNDLEFVELKKYEEMKLSIELQFHSLLTSQNFVIRLIL